MSGYLQRLVSTARGATRSVHPLLAPMFSAPTVTSPDSVTELGADSNPDISAPAQASPVAAPSARNIPGPAIETRSLDPEASSPSAPMSREPSLFRPLLLSPQQEVLSGETSFVQPSLNGASQRGSTAKRWQMADRAPNEVVPKPIYQPLMNEIPRRLDGERAEIQKPASADSPFEKRRTEMPLSRTRERESDEIQIHIGRIEVTAVQQSSARLPVKSAREGPSLAEFLKRRGGMDE